MFYDISADGYILRIRVTPNASKCAAAGIFIDEKGKHYLKVSLTAVPEKGKANQDLIKFLSKTLKISKSSFSIISGETDRFKRLSLNIEKSEDIENIMNRLEQTA